METWDVQIICDGMDILQDVRNGKPESDMLFNPEDFDWESFWDNYSLLSEDILSLSIKIAKEAAMSKIPIRTPEERWPEMKNEVPMPKVNPPKKRKGELGDLLAGLPEDFKKRVQSVWVNSDGSMSIDFAPEGGGTSEETEK